MARSLTGSSLLMALGLVLSFAVLELGTRSVVRVGASVAEAQEASPADPGTWGPYKVGATSRTFTRLSNTDDKPRTLETVLWYPAIAAAGDLPVDQRLAAPLDAAADRTGAPYPVIVFSHSSGGQPWNVTYFTTHLASHGFVVIAPPHPGNTTTDCPRPCSFDDPTSLAAIEDAIANRPGDLAVALDQVLSASPSDDPLLSQLIDGERIGISGYSLGAGVTLGIVATDQRYRAAAVLAPTVGARSLAAARNATRPVMVIAGKLDDHVPFDDTQRLYDAFPSAGPERWLIALPRAGHFTFSDRCPQPQRVGCGPNDLPIEHAHALVNRWATAFLLRYVAGDNHYGRLLEPELAVGDPEIQVSVAP